VPEHHISRRELKQDKIKETLEHGAEAVISHGQFAGILVAVVLAVAIGYGGWHVYIDRQTAQASVAFDQAVKAYQGRVGPPNPADPGESAYADERARSQDAYNKFSKVADSYPSTNPGKLARYYAALCLEDLDKQNQALEELKKISAISDGRHLRAHGKARRCCQTASRPGGQAERACAASAGAVGACRCSAQLQS
jgi:hypothetical protein